VTSVFAISAPVAALIGAAVAAAINLLVLAAVGLREERRRRRDFYAAALEATLAYREFAYAIPRRRHDALAEKRVRLSEALREVQRDLARAESLMRVERATKVAAAYRQLVGKTRDVAGGYMREAWERDPITTDAEMNTGAGLDFSRLDEFEAAYLDAVDEDLKWYRFWR
jgi:hypothetical protein